MAGPRYVFPISGYLPGWELFNSAFSKAGSDGMESVLREISLRDPNDKLRKRHPSVQEELTSRTQKDHALLPPEWDKFHYQVVADERKSEDVRQLKILEERMIQEAKKRDQVRVNESHRINGSVKETRRIEGYPVPRVQLFGKN